MPLEIETNHNIPTVSVFFSETIELMTTLYALNRYAEAATEEVRASLDMEWLKSIIKNLSPKSIETLKAAASFRLEGLELIEFVLREEIFNDIPRLLAKIENYKDSEFIYTFLGEEIAVERIESTIANKQALNLLVKEELCLDKCNPKNLKRLFYETEAFKKDIILLLEEINNPHFGSKISSLKGLYQKEINELKKQLENRSPLEFAQEITGRKFRRIFDFKDYMFIPSYTIQPKNIRFFNQQIQMIIYSVDTAQDAVREMGDRISAMLKVLSDRTRLEILRNLMVNGPSYGKLLADKMNLTTATISHHLEQLRDMALVTEARDKNIKYFSVNREALERLFNDSKHYFFDGKDKK